MMEINLVNHVHETTTLPAGVLPLQQRYTAAASHAVAVLTAHEARFVLGLAAAHTQQIAQAFIAAKKRYATSSHGSTESAVLATVRGLGKYVSANGANHLTVGGEGRSFIRTGKSFASSTFKDNLIELGGEGTDILPCGGLRRPALARVLQPRERKAGADNAEHRNCLNGEIGNERGDVVFGLAGQDIAKGGAGDDLTLGDRPYTPYSKSQELSYLPVTTQFFAQRNTCRANSRYRIAFQKIAASEYQFSTPGLFLQKQTTLRD